MSKHLKKIIILLSVIALLIPLLTSCGGGGGGGGCNPLRPYQWYAYSKGSTATFKVCTTFCMNFTVDIDVRAKNYAYVCSSLVSMQDFCHGIYMWNWSSLPINPIPVYDTDVYHYSYSNGRWVKEDLDDNYLRQARVPACDMIYPGTDRYWGETGNVAYSFNSPTFTTTGIVYCVDAVLYRCFGGGNAEFSYNY